MKHTRDAVRGAHRAAELETLETRRLLAIVINEVLAANTNGLADQDGDRSDWIELKNTGPSTVNLGGWYLTDDNANLTKWQFPSTNLPANGYLVVFASDKNRAVSGQELHTNFKLTSDGEAVSLVQADGTTIESSMILAEQFNNKSFGPGVSPSSTSNVTLVGDSSPLSVFVPNSANAARDDHWHEIDYNDSTWLAGTGSVGWDINGTSPNLVPFMGRVLTTSGGSPEVNTNANYSIYVRYEFNVTDPAQLTALQMDLLFDDGFIAYLNGRQIARANFAEDFAYNQPQWNSYAGNQTTGSTSNAANRVDESDDVATWDLTRFLPFLVNGANVLTFHGVNSNSTTLTHRQDFLIDPTLSATRATGAVANSFMVTPTPGSNNGVGTLGVVSDTHFSVDRGFYTSPQSVVINTTTPGASIRYTTDGSAPSATNGTLYTGSIPVNQTTILRSIAYKTGWTPTDVDVETYIFLDDVIHQSAADVTLPYATWGHDKDTDGDTTSGYNLDDESDWDMDPQIVNGNETAVKNALTAIPTMSLVMDWDDLFSGAQDPGTFAGSGSVAPQTRGIYIMGRSKERYTSMEYMIPGAPLDGFHTDAAIEIQGHSSPTRWNSDKLSFQVSFKGPFGAKSLDYPLFAGTPDGQNATTHFNGLILDAMFNYSWLHNNVQQRDYARYVTDQAVADLQNIISGGGEAPHGKYVQLYLNGLYWGLYNVHERPDDGYAAEYYGGEKEDYYVIKHAPNDIDNNHFTWVEGGVSAESAYTSLLNATRAVESSPTSAALYNNVKGMLDVDAFMDYMIAEYYGGNTVDWAHNNWYATFNHVDAAGRWRFHAWDNEHAYPTTDNGDTVDQFTNLTGKDDPNAPTEIFVNLMANYDFRLKFADHVQALMNNNGLLTSGPSKATYELRTNEIDQAIIGESARWGDNRVSNDPYTRTDFINVKNGVLANFFPTRTDTVRSQFAAATVPSLGSITWIPTVTAPVYSSYGGTVSLGTSLTISKPGGSPGAATIYYTTDGSDPRPSTGVPDNNIAHTTTSANLTINTSQRIKARIYFDQSGVYNDWSPIIDATFIVNGSFPVRITELNYHPPHRPALLDDEDAEFIELLNTGGATVSLEGLKIAGFSNTPYVFGAGMTLGAGQRIVVAKNPTVFQSIYGAGINLAPAGYGTDNLSNGGEPVSLIGPLGDTLQSFVYDDVAPWPTSPDGGGPSLEIINPLGDETNAANWRASLAINGSPGTDGLPYAIDAAWRDVVVQLPGDLLGVLQASNLHITPAGGGATITPTSIAIDTPNHRARFTVASPFADGNYTAMLSTNASSYPISFFTLTADANHDRQVDSLDFTALAIHFNQTGAVGYSNGDFNNDGNVNALDFNALATRFGSYLPLATPIATAESPRDSLTTQRFAPVAFTFKWLFSDQEIDASESEPAAVI